MFVMRHNLLCMKLYDDILNDNSKILNFVIRQVSNKYKGDLIKYA